jgi:hypothetical protein
VRLLIVVVVLLAACWRGGASTQAPQPSFIARKNALVELRRSTDALFDKLERTMQQISGLASEAEREAIRIDLDVLDRDLVQLARYTAEARARGDSPSFLDSVQHKLERAALVLLSLREELRYAKTTAELAALDELSRDEGNQRADERRLVIRRLIETQPQPQLDVEPELTRRRRTVRIETP